MDWLKRNWVDVLMGGLIFAIAAGVLVVLLRGGLFVSNKPGNTSTTVGNPNPTVAPPATPTSGVTTINTPTTTPVPDPIPTTTRPTSVKPTASITPRVTANLSVPEIPDAPSTETTPPKVAPNQATTQTQPIQTAKPSRPVEASKLPSPSKPPSSTKPNSSQPSKPSQSKYSRADFLRNYRIAAGSYANLERAVRAVSWLRGRGLPAQQFSSGNTYVVVVGPYAREASARSALVKVRQTLPDAILYRPDGSREGVAKKPAPTQQKQGGAGSSAATITTIAYLQVGAFKDSGKASGLLEKLKNAGFAPLTKNIAGLLRVLVGPLQPSQIETTRVTLKNQGFDAFPILL
jgi:cell division protein FtsN